MFHSPLTLDKVTKMSKQLDQNKSQVSEHWRGYGDLEADTVLVSTEGKRFRVPSYHLKAARYSAVYDSPDEHHADLQRVLPQDVSQTGYYALDRR